METYLIYIAKTALAAGAFYLAFLVFFQNQKHFVFNRIYLPVSLAVSFIIPLITFTTVKYIGSNQLSANDFAFLMESEETIQTGFVFEWYHYLLGIYILGVLGFLFHLLLGHLKAIHIVRSSQIKQLFGIRVHVTKTDVHPFSFFDKIVISERTLGSKSLEMIVHHENIHVKEKHTLDILFTEILFLLQWFNPFAWLLKDAVKNNLEYKTDHQITKNHNPKIYQMAMVALADKKGVAPFLTALNGSQLKNRIIMMKKKTENKFAIIKQMVVLPLIAILVMGLSAREVKTEIVPKPVNQATEKISAEETVVKGKITDTNGKPISGAMIIVKGKTTGTITDASGNYVIKLKGENETLVFAMAGFEKQEVAVKDKTEINIQLKADSSAKSIQIKADENAEPPANATKISIRNIEGKEEPLYVVNGKIVEDVDFLSPDFIESISVLKDHAASDSYGEKGKNGVVEITTKKEAKNPISEISENPLIIIDGKESSIPIQAIDPEKIESINVIKDEAAIAKYGEKAKEGVIEITTKKKLEN